MNHTTTGDEPGLLADLRAALDDANKALRALKELWDGTPVQGRQWHRPAWQRPDVHPDWCAQDHTCTVQHNLMGPRSEHRSPPHRLTGRYCTMHATRVQPLANDRRPYLEMTIRVRLSPDSRKAFAQSALTPVALNTAVDALLAQLDVNFTRAAMLAAVRAQLCDTPSAGRNPR